MHYDDEEETIQLKTTGGSVELQMYFFHVPYSSVEFDLLFDPLDKFRELTASAEKGILKASPIRGLCWRILLGTLRPHEKYSVQIKTQRTRYESLISKHVIDPRTIEDEYNPLSKTQNNKWAKYFENQELERLIIQDLDRLYPEYPFFSTEKVQAILKRILFIWSKEYPDPSYRQGMHELLANIYLVLHREVRSQSDYPILSSHEELAVLLDKDYIEHDTFVLFEQLMKKMVQFFQVKNVKRSGMKSDEKDLMEEEMIGHDTHIIDICQKIQNVLLKKRDPFLSNHLIQLRIEPQIYGLRWIRLLFGREFFMDDTLLIWDVIFSQCGGQKLKEGEVISLDFMEHIAVSMLVYLSSDLKKMDYNDCLTKLLRFPRIDDVMSLIIDSLACTKNDYQSFNPHVYKTPVSLQSPSKGNGTSPVKAKIRPLPGLRTKNMFGEETLAISEHEKQIKIGLQMEKIINILQTEFVSPNRDDVAISIAIAELKQLKDILKGQIPFDESLFYDYTKLDNKDSKSTSTIKPITTTTSKIVPIYDLTSIKGDVGLN